jgi:hypothetical protein
MCMALAKNLCTTKGLTIDVGFPLDTLSLNQNY